MSLSNVFTHERSIKVNKKKQNESDDGKRVVGGAREHLFSDGIRKRKMRNDRWERANFCATTTTTRFEEEEREVRAPGNESDDSG